VREWLYDKTPLVMNIGFARIHSLAAATGTLVIFLANGKKGTGSGVLFKHFRRVGEDTFEMYLRYRYRYMRGCIFGIFRYFRYRYH